MPMPAAASKSSVLLGMTLVGAVGTAATGSSATAFVCTTTGGGGGGDILGRSHHPTARSPSQSERRWTALPRTTGYGNPSAAAADKIFGAGAANALRLSSIGHDDPDESSGGGENNLGPRPTGDGKNNEAKSFPWRDVLRLPPPPEDQIAMSGDVAVLFVYSFLDHILSDLYASAVSAGDAGTATALDPTLAADVAAAQQLPVWVGPETVGGGLSALPSLGYVPYAPAISTAGTSAVVLTTAWLVAGYFTGAFLYKNTVGCTVQSAVAQAGKTWLWATVLSVGVALASDAAAGEFALFWEDAVRNPSLGGLTKADADFLFGSLSVLAMWRFVLSSMLGYGGGGSDE